MSDGIRKKRGNPFRRGKTWTFYFFVNGEQKYRGGYASQKEAKAEMKHVNSLVAQGKYVPTRITCADFLTQWLEEVKKPALQYNSYNSYKNAIRHMNNFLGKRKLEKIDRTTIVKLYAYLCDFSPSVARVAKSALVLAFDHALEERHILTNYAREVNLPISPPKREKVNLTKEEIEQLIAESAGTAIHLAVILSLMLGPRKGEVWGLKFSDVDYQRKQIRVRRALGRTMLDPESEEYKNRKKKRTLTKAEKRVKTENGYRPIPLSNYVINEIRVAQFQCEKNKQMHGDQYIDQGYIICSEFGSPYSTSYNWKPFQALLEKVGISQFRWHDMRAVNASFLHASGISSKAIAKVLGHADDVVTSAKYLNTTPSQIEAIEDAANYIFGLLDDPGNPNPPVEPSSELSASG